MIYEKPRLVSLAPGAQEAAGACVTGISNLDTTACNVGIHAPNAPCNTGNGPSPNADCVTGVEPGVPLGSKQCLAGGTAANGCAFGAENTGGSCNYGFTPL